MVPELHTSHQRKCIAILISWVVTLLAAGYFVSARALPSPFFYRRLTNLILVTPTSGIDFSAILYETIPGGASYLLVTSTVTGEPLRAIATYPTVLLISIVSYYVLGSALFPNRRWAALLALSSPVYLYAATSGFSEYGLGKTLYPLAVGLIGHWLLSGDQRYAILSVVPLAMIKFLSPHAEVWVISFLVILILTVVLSSKVTHRPYTEYNHLVFYLLMAGGVFAIHNPKVYVQLFAMRYEILLDFTFGGSAAVSAFHASPASPPVARLLNALFLSIAGLGAIIGVSWLLIRVASRRSALSTDDLFTKRDCLAVGFFGGLLPDTIVLAALGRIVLQVATYTGVAVCLHALRRSGITVPVPDWRGLLSRSDDEEQRVDGGQRLRSVSAVTIVGCLLVIVAAGGQVAYVADDGYRPLGDPAANAQAANWVANESPSSNPILTDYHTEALFRVELAESQLQRSPGQDPRAQNFLDATTYSAQTYRYLVGEAAAPEESFSLYVLNHQTDHKTAQKAGSWEHYNPPREHHHQISTNTNLDAVYSSGGYTVYSDKRD